MARSKLVRPKHQDGAPDCGCIKCKPPDEKERIGRAKRSGRKKGHDWERAVAYEHLQPIFGEGQVRRGKQSREGHDEPDVIVPEEAALWIECESSKLCNIRGKLRQAHFAEGQHRIKCPSSQHRAPKAPVAILKDTNSGPPIVAMYLPNWLELVRQWWQLKHGDNRPTAVGALEARGDLRDMRDSVRDLARELLALVGEDTRPPHESD